jgi:hypothetical protein
MPSVSTSDAVASPVLAPVRAGQGRTMRQSSYRGSPPAPSQSEGFSPWLNLICVTLGTLIAVAWVPENPQTEGALRSSGLAMALAMAAGPLAATFGNPRNVLRTENIIGFMPFYWLLLDLVTGSYAMTGISADEARKVFWVIGVYLIAYWIGTMAKPWPLHQGFLRSCQIRPEASVLFPVVLICFCLAMLKFAMPCKFDVVVMFRYALMERWGAPWGRGNFGSWDAFADHLAYFGYLLPTFAVMIAQKKSWLNPMTLVALLCAGIFLLFLSQSGARRVVGVCLVAAIFTWVINQRQLRGWHLTILAMGMAAVLVLMQMMIITRGVGFGRAGLELAGRAAIDSMSGKETAAGAPKAIHVDDNFLRLAQTVSLIPEKYDYVYHRQLYYIIARPIPRALWPGKPTDPGFSLHALVATGASLSTSILGEFWISLGFPAVFLGGWFYGRLARMSSPLLKFGNGTVAPMFYGYMTMTLFVGFRSLVEVILFSYALLGWMAANWLLKKFFH